MLKTRGQWSRPPPALTLGVRPNSLLTTTSVVSSSPAPVEIGDQAGEGAVEVGHLGLDAPVVVGVRVPRAEGHRHEAGPGLDQPSGDQEPGPGRTIDAQPLADDAVQRLDLVGLALEAERLACLR